MRFVLCGDEKLSCSVVTSNSQTSRDKLVLFLPGGGKDLGKERFELFQERLAKEGISSASFDFSGVGDSTGDLEDSSLEDRTQQTICVTKSLQNKFPEKEFVLYGVSMSGYVALSVVDEIPDQFSKLILHAPAAYAKESYKVNFNEEFTRVLHEENSWQSSQSFTWLKNFDEHVLLLVGRDDEVIPQDITKRYAKIVEEKNLGEVTFIPDMKHNIWEGDNAKHYQDIILDKVCNFLI